MKTVTTLLLGSAAAALVAAAANAAELPAKAKPVEYVKVCPQYGAGFWYVPGTNTCIKVGQYVRFQWEWQATGGQVYLTGANARFTRTDTPDLQHRVRGVISLDTRTQTEWGQLRGYVRAGAEQTTPNTPDEAIFFDRGFIQFGGFTVGRAESFYDLVSLARYNYINQRLGSNMGATGQQVFAYTWRFGGGFSASLSAEDGGASAAGNAGNNSRARGKITVDLDSAPMGLGALTVDNGSYAMPDVVANLRVDQSWGSAMLKAALHQNRGGYYTSFPAGAGVSCTGGTANTTQCGHPDDKLGWAIGAGVALNIPGLPGDSISLESNYAQGATGYTSRANQSWRMWGDGRSIGLGWASDSIFRNGTDLELTRSWGLVAAAEHRWNPQWRTSVYGGYERIDYSARAEDMICSRGAFAGSPSALAGVAVANCSPDLSWWNIGTRTQWNPHPLLDIGLDVVYHRLNTAHRGTGATTANDGARAAGSVAVEDQDHLSAMFRIQYNLLP
jgi:porin-like protein